MDLGWGEWEYDGMGFSSAGAMNLLRKFWWVGLPLVAAIGLVGLVPRAQTDDGGAPVRPARVVASFPHDPDAFTQGLAIEGNSLYEGTGQYGQSSLRRIDLETGAIESEYPLPANYFGEGITVLGDRIYQLTWKEGVCLVYDKASLKPIASLRYPGEGWGLATDDRHLFLSDGTSTIRVLDPKTFQMIRRVRVKQGRRPIDKLNELEYVNGELLANIWYSDQIARIDPTSGEVVGWIDCSAIYPARQRPSVEHVLNGIARDAASGRLFITGKNWPRLYEIEIGAGE